MENVSFIDYVKERDIDLLLLEEFMVSPEFCGWFISKTTEHSGFFNLKAWRSVVDEGLGESDLIVIYELEQQKCALMIENKISALEQDDQSGRYLARGELGISSGRWTWFSTCIVAPESYLSSNNEAHKYKSKVSYEEIESFFRSSSDHRSLYKANFIKEAIEQNRRGYTAIRNDAVTTFQQHYWKHIKAHFPELTMRPPGVRAATSTWIDLKSRLMHKSIKIVHKMERGHMDMQISADAASYDQLEEFVRQLNQPEFIIVQHSRSCSIRLEVPKIDAQLPFEDHILEINTALHNAVALANLSLNIPIATTFKDLGGFKCQR